MLLALCVFGALVSLHHFDAIGSHAVEAHEESLVFAYQGVTQPDVLHPLEVNPLLLRLYTAMGMVAGPDMTGFVILALLLGGLGALFAGLAGQLLTGSARAGQVLALLLALHPTLAYWRVQGFHVAPPHAAFCATLLAAVLVSRRPERRNVAAWLVLAAFTLSFRTELAGAVVGTALLPLLCGPRGWWRQAGRWLPGLGLAALLVVPNAWSQLQAVETREDYWTGLRFLGLHLGIPELFEPLTQIPVALALVAAVVLIAWLGSPEERRYGAALGGAALLGLFPAILFAGFGPRHLLPTSTLALLLVVCGALPLARGRSRRASSEAPPRSGWTAAWSTLVVATLLVGWSGSLSWARLSDMAERYGIDPTFVPALPDTPRPTTTLDLNPSICGSYSGSGRLCNDWLLCQPPKDLRDPVRVAARWDESPGECILWAIDDREDDVRGVRHEYWMVLKRLYDWEPAGFVEFTEDDADVPDEERLVRRAEVYRLRARP